MLHELKPTLTFVCKRLVYLQVSSSPSILEDPTTIQVRSPPFCLDESPARGKGKREVAAKVVHSQFTTFQVRGEGTRRRQMEIADSRE